MKKSTIQSAAVVAWCAAIAACNAIAGLDGLKHPCEGVPESQSCPVLASGGASSSSTSGSGGSGGSAGGGGDPDHCKNGERDVDETDVDCGGSCVTCGNGKGCDTGADCASHSCPAHTCVPPQCGDMVQNGDETDVDCGGGSCPGCENHKACEKASDCASGSCVSKLCVRWATALVAGGVHTCALRPAGGVSCWGNALASGSATPSSVPVDVSGLPAPVTAIAAGRAFTCALTNGGGVYCWGANSMGQLGNGSTTSTTTPVAVAGLSSGVTAIAAAQCHACAVTSAGSVKCWGENDAGELGNNSTISSAVPVAVWPPPSDVATVSAGGAFSCAVTSAGAPWCWGYNQAGMLGDGNTVQSNVPVQVSALTAGVSAIRSGGGFSCAVTLDGAVKCWGDNTFGQIGNGSAGGTSLQPVSVSGLASGITALSTGYSHACAVKGGGISCWGWNSHGQLGDQSTDDRSAPAAVYNLGSGVAAVTAGGEHTCALTTAGAALCWGCNSYGELGDGTHDEHHVPVKVVETP